MHTTGIQQGHKTGVKLLSIVKLAWSGRSVVWLVQTDRLARLPCALLLEEARIGHGFAHGKGAIAIPRSLYIPAYVLTVVAGRVWRGFRPV